MTETGHSDSIAENSELSLRGDFIKKYWSSGGVFCYQTSLIRHGRVNSKGPLLQRSSTESPKTLTISSKPLVLDIRPLSDYQQTLIDTILRLRSEGWLDRQIANHFNAIGSLTPRGHRFIPQSIYSMRKKYERRLARIGEVAGQSVFHCHVYLTPRRRGDVENLIVNNNNGNYKRGGYIQ